MSQPLLRYGFPILPFRLTISDVTENISTSVSVSGLKIHDSGGVAEVHPKFGKPNVFGSFRQEVEWRTIVGYDHFVTGII